MNRTLWVKTVTTSTNGCGTAESGNTWIDVRNCREGGIAAGVSAGTVANMPFGETITYTASTPVDGTFERFQFQWNGTGGAWEDWELGGRWRVWRGRRRCEGGGAVREAAVTVVEARAAVTVEVEETGTA